MATVWEQIDELARQGKGAIVTLSAAQEVKIPKGPPGRPPSRLPPFMGYAFWQGSNDIKNRMGGKRPRCQRSGCGRHLRKDQRWVCSDACADTVIDESLRVLALTKYKLIDRAADYNAAVADKARQRYLADGALLEPPRQRVPC
jgi:hypothetical protein